MPPKRRGSSMRSQSKRAKNSTTASTRSDNVTQSDGQTALAIASVEQLRSLSASSLRHHLKANICPVFKKGNRSNPSNYRPISLTSSCCKVFEHIIFHSIMDHIQLAK